MNRATTLVLSPELADTLDSLAQQPVETGAVLLARRARLFDDSLRLIGTQLVAVPDHAYLSRTDKRMTVGSEGYMPALHHAEETESVALWVHTHPSAGSTPRPSRHDMEVDRQLADTFALRTGTGIYGALILSRHNGHLTFTGHLTGSEQAVIDRIFIAGARFRLLQSFDAPAPDLPNLHDRHIRAFGPDITRVLAQLRIAIVGTGGTGSAVAEQLARLGVGHLTLIDPDTLSDSNLTRVYGSTPDDVGRHKADVLADYLHRIAPTTAVTAVVGSVSQLHIARHVVGADIVFGCTDDDAGRMRLSRFSYTYRTPLIDCGVQIDADEYHVIRGIIGRVSVLHQGAACLLCRGRVSPQIAAAQERAPREQARLQREGYAPALPGTEPAVIAYTTATAAAAVNELLERLVGYGPEPAPTETLLRLHDRKTSSNTQEPHPGHYCTHNDPRSFGDTDRYWGLAWPDAA
ncbi:ThiF family adenylyltransferase [Streptomyces sp. NPDC004680]|uniref:HesA/MoeB/ThiF family protein n=1 Tax=Streptomyces sp. NPDC004680 TaxID=3154287 RepID=UPI0033B11F51